MFQGALFSAKIKKNALLCKVFAHLSEISVQWVNSGCNIAIARQKQSN